MNHREDLQLEINTIWQSLDRAGWAAAARSVAAAADSAGDDLIALFAAADHARWHLQQLENAGRQAMNQYDRDCG